MRAVHDANGTSQAAIFARLWETKQGRLPRTLARYILRLGFSQQEKARMHELAVKNQEGVIAPAELEALQNYVTVGDLLALLQSRARRALKEDNRSPLRHG